jgi:EF-hand domain
MEMRGISHSPPTNHTHTHIVSQPVCLSVCLSVTHLLSRVSARSRTPTRAQHTPHRPTHWLTRMAHKKTAKEAFDMFDMDKNGLIDIKELRCVMQALGEAPTDARMFHEC